MTTLNERPPARPAGSQSVFSSGPAENQTLHTNHSAPQVRILEFKPVEKNTLRGYFDIELASGLILRGCTLQFSHDRFWVGLPAKPYQAAGGKQSWARIVDFRDKRTADRFQEIATAAAVAAFEQGQARGAA